MTAWGALAWGVVEEGVPGPLPAFSLAEAPGRQFLAAEVDVFLPGGTAGAAQGEAWGVLAWGALTQQPQTVADFTVLRASDAGYVTRESDAVGLLAFPPILLAGVEIDRAMDLAPNGQGAAAGWGALRFANEAGALTPLAASRNADGRAVRVRLGRKQMLPHGVWRDPSWSETAEIFGGLGAGWSLNPDEAELRLSMRDATYWLERRADGATYAGTGGLEGTAEMAGRRKPRLRGGSAAAPVREIPAVLVDPVAGIYQVSDAPGGIVALYERGLSGGITFNAAVADITAAAPPAARYNVESSARGLFIRLGTFPPAGQITVDAWGAFPDGAAPSAVARVALEMLRQDFAVPAAYLDAGSFIGLASDLVPGGVWLADDADAAAVAGLLLRSAAARLVPRRNGMLAAIALRAFGAGRLPVASYTPAQIIACAPRDLGAPPFRIRVGYQRFAATQTSDLAPTLSGARRQELASEWRIATASDAGVLAAWRRPVDPPIVETALTSAAAAQALADALRDLWCVAPGRRLYDVTLPLAYALRHDIGEPIEITYPGELAAGALGRIVGEQLRTADNAAILQVLV
ncbi:hypothetical protein [Synechococcus phage MinM1]|nr:hypothetical protein [Synechococcus phage MinM1]